MQVAPVPENEEERLRSLRSYAILDTPSEPAFDALVELASQICDTPIALLSLVDRGRQWFKAKRGLGVPELPRSVAFCAHAILIADVFTVPDASADPRFADNPLVIGEPRIRFYAGMPVCDGEGRALGALCIIDRQPRSLSPLQMFTLRTLARQVEAHLELRAGARHLAHVEQQLRRYAETERDAAVAERERFFELSSELLCVLDDRDRFKRVNPAFARTLDIAADAIVGSTFERYIHPDDVEPMRAEVKRRLDHHELGTTPLECRLRRADGSARWVSWTLLSRRDGGLVYAMAQDVTERKLFQAQLLHAQKMEAVGRLAGGIAHDFNNLLTTMMGFGQMVDEGLPDDSPLRDDMREVLRSGERAANLTRQLLLFSRKNIAEPATALNLNALVLELDKMLRRVIGEDIALTTVAGDELWPVRAERPQIEQIVMNLVINARDAMEAGGRLTIETANVQFDEAYRDAHSEVAAGDYVMLAVTDTGCGMDEATRERVFEPFFTTKQVGKGTGLGLATVFGIATALAGYVWAYSELGHGTVFKVYLPRSTGASISSSPPTASKDELRGTECVLVVEDDPTLREFLRRSLSELGYAVHTAPSGQHALEWLEESAPQVDLLLTDLVMPGMRGGELAELVRARRPSVRVLFMSGYTEKEVEHEVVANGRIPFMQKPFTALQLARRIRALLGASHSA